MASGVCRLGWGEVDDYVLVDAESLALAALAHNLNISHLLTLVKYFRHQYGDEFCWFSSAGVGRLFKSGLISSSRLLGSKQAQSSLA